MRAKPRPSKWVGRVRVYSFLGRSGGGTSAHLQKIKIGRTIKMDFIKLSGPPMKKEMTLGGNEQLVYESTEIKSLTFPRG